MNNTPRDIVIIGYKNHLGWHYKFTKNYAPQRLKTN